MTVKLRKKKLADETISLYLDIYDKGYRKYEFLDIKIIKPKTPADRQTNKENLELANKVRAKREHELNSSVHGISSADKQNVDFILYFEKFNEVYSKKDVRMFISSLKKFKEFVLERTGRTSIPAKLVTESLLQEFRDHLESCHTGETPHDYFSKLKRVINKAIKDGLFKNDPTSDIKNTRNAAKIKDVLNFEELNILSQTQLGDAEVKRAFLFSCVTGLRWCDVKELRWSGIKNDYLSIIQAKTGKPAHINLNETAQKLIGNRGKSDELVFNLPSSTAANKWLKKWMENAKIEKNITWHCARHSFGTNIMYYDGDILSASKLLGHSSLTYTQRYVRAAEQMKQNAVNNLPSIQL